MKNLIVIALLATPLFAHSAKGETSTDTEPKIELTDARIFFYQMTPTVRVAITNDWCTNEEVRKTHPWVSYQFHIEQGKISLALADAVAVGCFGPKDINTISFVWENEIPFELPANAFLLPQDLYHREVPQVPQIDADDWL